MKCLMIALAFILVSGITLVEKPTRADQRKQVMEYLCKKEPTLCGERGWMKEFEGMGDSK